MTLTTTDEALCRQLEPYVCTTKECFAVLKKLNEAGISTVVWLSPILPFINDTKENLQTILDYCNETKVYGIICFSMGLTLREGNREYFYQQLDRLLPGLKEKHQRIYGNRYEVTNLNNEGLMNMFYQRCQQYGIVHDNQAIFSYLKKYEKKDKFEQLQLF